MSLGTYLAFKMDRLLSALKFFAGFLILFYIISGVFNSVWADKLNDGLFDLLYRGKPIRNFSISQAVLSFGFFFMSFLLVVILYIFGAAKLIQLILLIVSLGSMIGTIVLLGLTVSYCSQKSEDLIRDSFITLLNQQPPKPEVEKWADRHDCNISEPLGCHSDATHYVNQRVRINFIFNICLLVLICVSLLGLLCVLFFMSLIKPVDRNKDHETTSDQEETVTHTVQLEQPADPPRKSRDQNKNAAQNTQQNHPPQAKPQVTP